MEIAKNVKKYFEDEINFRDNDEQYSLFYKDSKIL